MKPASFYTHEVINLVRENQLSKLVDLRDLLLQIINKDVCLLTKQDLEDDFITLNIALAFHELFVNSDTKAFILDLFKDAHPLSLFCFRIFDAAFVGTLDQAGMNDFLRSYFNNLRRSASPEFSLTLPSSQANIKIHLEFLLKSLLTIVFSNEDLLAFSKLMNINISTAEVSLDYPTVEREIYQGCARYGRLNHLKYFVENKVSHFTDEPSESKAALNGSYLQNRMKLISVATHSNQFSFLKSLLTEWMYPFLIEPENAFTHFENLSASSKGEANPDLTSEALKFLVNCFSISRQYQAASLRFIDMNRILAIILKMVKEDLMKVDESFPFRQTSNALFELENAHPEDREFIVSKLVLMLFESKVYERTKDIKGMVDIYKAISAHLPIDNEKKGAFLISIFKIALELENINMSALCEYTRDYAYLDTPSRLSPVFTNLCFSEQYWRLLSYILKSDWRQQEAWLNAESSSSLFSSLMQHPSAKYLNKPQEYVSRYYAFSLLRTLVIEGARFQLDVNYIQVVDLLNTMQPSSFIPPRQGGHIGRLLEGDSYSIRSIDGVKTPFPEIAKALILYCLKTQVLGVVQNIFQSRTRLSYLAYAGWAENFDKSVRFSQYIERQYMLTIGSALHHLRKKMPMLPNMPSEIWAKTFSYLSVMPDENRSEAIRELNHVSALYAQMIYQPLMEARVGSQRRRRPDDELESGPIKRAKI